MFNLLICDDHPPIRTVVRLLAREAAGGCDVTETGNAPELLDALRGRRPFDLLTLDVQLPGRSGLEVLAEAKTIRPDLPVMMLSADERESSVTAALKAGASSYVFKSSSEHILFEALKHASQHRLSLPEAYAGTAGACAADALALSARQRDVLDCLLRGMSGKQIARALSISEGTVKSHTVAVFRSLNVNSRAQAVVEAHRRGISIGR
ncbi:MAG: response regulator transcription factor [Variovorax sp.]|nr:response regulator transcription factor [Variovorax sp.]